MVEPDRSLAGYHHQSKAGDYKTTEREDFKQHLVRFYWTPLEQTYGYLLEPNKKGNILPLSQYSTNRKQLSDGEEKLIEISPTN